MSSRRDSRDRERSRGGGRDREPDPYESYKKVTRREDSRSRPAARRSDDRGDDRSRGREREDDYRRSDRREDDRGRREDDRGRREDDRGRREDDRSRRDDDRGRYRDDGRGRGRDDDRGRDRDDVRGRDRDDDRGRDRDEDRGRRKKTGWGDDAPKASQSGGGDEAPPDWLKDLVGGAPAPGPEPMHLGNGGCGFGGPPPTGTRLNCKTIQIPVDAKPWLIGTKGKTINEIRAKSQSMIQINNQGPGDKTVTVMITGNVELVEKLIKEHLGEWGAPANTPQPNEAVLAQVKQIQAGVVRPMQVAPPVQLSAASIWNWNT